MEIHDLEPRVNCLQTSFSLQRPSLVSRSQTNEIRSLIQTHRNLVYISIKALANWQYFSVAFGSDPVVA